MRTLLLLTMLLAAHYLALGQLEVHYGGKNFGPSEVIEAQVGNDGQSLSFIVSEIDTDVMSIPDSGLPEFYQLLVDVDLIESLPFPITAAKGNQLTVALSRIKAQIENDAYVNEQIDSAAATQEASAAHIDTRSIEERAQEIALKMQNGELSYEEGSKQIEALSQAALEQVEAIETPEITDLPERSTFEVVYFDTRLNTRSTVISGRLRIIEFTETSFIAELNGQQMVECLEVRSAAAPENATECSQATSSLLPDVTVLSEGPVSMRIKVRLKRFTDNR